MLHNTNSAVFQHCSKSPFLIGFAKFALRSVATIIDKIRRISVETMSNIPENHHVNFISILCQKAFTNLQFFLRGFDPPLLFFLTMFQISAKLVLWGIPYYPKVEIRLQHSSWSKWPWCMWFQVMCGYLANVNYSWRMGKRRSWCKPNDHRHTSHRCTW